MIQRSAPPKRRACSSVAARAAWATSFIALKGVPDEEPGMSSSPMVESALALVVGVRAGYNTARFQVVR
jgi:hypothetical protein